MLEIGTCRLISFLIALNIILTESDKFLEYLAFVAYNNPSSCISNRINIWMIDTKNVEMTRLRSHSQTFLIISLQYVYYSLSYF